MSASSRAHFISTLQTDTKVVECIFNYITSFLFVYNLILENVIES